MKIAIPIFLILIIGAFGFVQYQAQANKEILMHIVDLNEQNLRFLWKDQDGNNFKNFERVKNWAAAHSEKLVFAMNGGMYKKDLSPLGLYIENGNEKSPKNKRQKAHGNFYLQPNGIFYITNNNTGIVCKTQDFKSTEVKYATQSGPMLVIDGKLHPKFKKGSMNLNIRNGVGVLPDGKLLFALSKNKINLYDFATYFQSQGCQNALYLDGYISKAYLPAKEWNDLKGNFGVIIAEVESR